MKIKQIFAWNWRNTWKGFAVYYAIILLSYLVTALLLGAFAPGGRFNVQPSTNIVLFVFGIILFPQGLRVGLIHGVSRRSVYLGGLAYALAASVTVSAVDAVIACIVAFWGGIDVQTVAEMLFPPAAVSSPLALLPFRFFEFAIGSILSAAFGFFVGGAYYRMNKTLKILVSIGVPALVFVLMPIAAGLYPELGRRIADAIGWCVASSLRLTCVALGLSALFGTSVWLFIRRAPLKAAPAG